MAGSSFTRKHDRWIYSQLLYSRPEVHELIEADFIVFVLVVDVEQTLCFGHVEAQLFL